MKKIGMVMMAAAMGAQLWEIAPQQTLELDYTSDYAYTSDDINEYLQADIANIGGFYPGDCDIFSITIDAGIVLQAQTFTDFMPKAMGLAVQVPGSPAVWEFAAITEAVEFDPAVSFASNAAETKAQAEFFASGQEAGLLIPVTFAHHGNLPGNASVLLDISGATNSLTGQLANLQDGDALTLYYYNPITAELEEVESVTANEGKVTLSLTHCSDYVLVAVENAGAGGSGGGSGASGSSGSDGSGAGGRGSGDNGTDGSDGGDAGASDSGGLDDGTGGADEAGEPCGDGEGGESSATQHTKAPKTGDQRNACILSFLGIMLVTVGLRRQKD